ncbi:MAG: MBL fold metallo-hydrolase, partial [Vicinamibacteria bacterium]
MPKAKAHYLANEGVLIVSDETRIAFDPLFRNDFGTYRLLPKELERALFAGEPPFTGLDAVFISHYHEDHFSPGDVLRLLTEREDVRLYAPAQAVSQMRSLAAADDGTTDLFSRVTEIRLEYKDPPVVIEAGDLIVEAVRIPHSGWPDQRQDVENIAYRVTLDESTTVVHLGDADAREVHFAHDASYWERRPLDMAFPPFWYLQSEEGRRVLEERLQ